MGEHSLRSWIVPLIFLMAATLLPQTTWARAINLGSLSDEAADEAKKFFPLASYLARQLQSEGIDQGMVVVANGVSQMATYLREGKVDLYIDSPFPSLAASRLSGSKILLRRWKKGLSEYYSVIFARQDGGIERLEDLRGKMFAFEEPFSSSGYFLPKVALQERGLRLVPKTEASERVGPEEVGYVFSRDDENTMVWVLRGKVAAAAMDHQTFLKYAKGKVDRLKIVHKTFPVPRQIVSYRADLPPKLVARIREILITMDQSEEGRKILHDFERTTKFDEVPENSLAQLRKLQGFIPGEFKSR